ncbi:MAG: (d)CMP kinase [Planctomycetes bacterium]|nr:(d)CMP kinase [Planctomycetota bacterium]
MIITIDGPAGSGKSTAARKLAAELGIDFLDTGATYRAVTLRAMKLGADMEDSKALVQIARQADISFRRQGRSLKVLLDGQDVSEAIRTEDVSRNSYYIARADGCRQVLVELQRRLGRQMGNFVSEGRDQGSVVFPDADFKIYLDASPDVRAQRRFDEAAARGEKVEYAKVLEDIMQRDRRDQSRATGPLVRPAGAIVVDTSGMTIEQVVARLLSIVRAGR